VRVASDKLTQRRLRWQSLALGARKIMRTSASVRVLCIGGTQCSDSRERETEPGVIRITTRTVMQARPALEAGLRGRPP
jgi:hypothetical protein